MANFPQQGFLQSPLSQGATPSLEQQAVGGDNRQQISNFMTALNGVGAGSNNAQMNQGQPMMQTGAGLVPGMGPSNAGQPQLNFTPGTSTPGTFSPGMSTPGNFSMGSFSQGAPAGAVQNSGVSFNPISTGSVSDTAANSVPAPSPALANMAMGFNPALSGQAMLGQSTYTPTNPTYQQPAMQMATPPHAQPQQQPMASVGTPVNQLQQPMPQPYQQPATVMQPPAAPPPQQPAPAPTPVAQPAPAYQPPQQPVPVATPINGGMGGTASGNTTSPSDPWNPGPFGTSGGGLPMDPNMMMAVSPYQQSAMQMSDQTRKQDISPAHARLADFMSKIGAHNYTYKDPIDGVGMFTSPMAQELERTDLGKQAVVETPRGKMVDYARLGGVNLAAVSVVFKEQEKMKQQLQSLQRRVNGRG